MRIHGLKALTALALLLPAAGFSADKAPGFVRVRGTGFEIAGKPYHYLGANFWYGINLGSQGPGGDRARLQRELDRLKAMGVTNLRVVGASEGPDTEPWRMVPALQTKPGVYNPDLLGGLDFLLAEMKKRDMKAVVVLNDFWPWSGGMAQYVKWSQGLNIPYPPPAEGGTWDGYQKFAAKFYSDAKAVKNFDKVVKKLVTRTNSITRQPYKDDPTIMAWQLANEPRGIDNKAAFEKWIDATAALIKSLDKNHLVTTGCEGDTPWPKDNGLDFIRDHSSPNIDYATIHIWVQNWGWYDPAKDKDNVADAQKKFFDYFDSHLELAKKLGKPLVLEEFGLARDNGVFDPGATTAVRGKFYAAVFEKVYEAARSDSPMAGVNFWAWSGEAVPPRPGAIWKPGDPFTGDPPHELQGWYGVYAADADTVKIITDWAAKLGSLAEAKQP